MGRVLDITNRVNVVGKNWEITFSVTVAKIVHSQRLSCLIVVKRDNNMAGAGLSINPYPCFKMHSCSEMLLSCVDFPTQQA